MSEQPQKIPLGNASRVSINISGVPVLVTWSDDVDEINVAGGELDVQHVNDEIHLSGRGRRGTGGADGILGMLPNISVPGVTIDWGEGGNSIQVDDDGVVIRRERRHRESTDAGFEIVLPMRVTTSSIEVDRNNLELVSPSGNVGVSLKSGNLRSTGGSAELVASMGSGDARVAQLSGALNLMGGSGDISILDCQATTNVKAGSGKVSLSNVSGVAVKVAAGSGDVDIRECVAQAFSCQTGSGDIDIMAGELDRINVRTGSGDVECSALFGPYTQSFNTGSGSVSLGVPRGLPARFEVATHGGDIDSDIPLVSVGQRGPRSRRTRRQVGSFGTGDPRADVTIRTASGDIRLHWLQMGTTAVPMPAPAPIVSAVPPVPETPEPGESGDTDIQDDADRDTEEADPRTAILDALARGEITVEEADVLLRQLEDSRS